MNLASEFDMEEDEFDAFLTAEANVLDDTVFDDIEACVGDTMDLGGAEGDVIPHKKIKRIPKELERQLAIAQKLYLSENYGEAIELLLEIVRQRPNFSVPYITLSMIHEETGDEDSALSYLLIAAQVSENDYELWANVAAKSKDQGNFKQAIYCYNKSILFSDKNIELLWEKAILLLDIGEYRRALDDFHKLLELHPGDPQVCEKIANIYIHYYSDHVQAEQTLQDCIEKGFSLPVPNVDMNISNLLIELYIMTEKYEEAQAFIARLVASSAEIPIEIHINHGMCMARQGNIAQAKVLFNLLKTFSPSEYGDLYLAVGQLFIELDQPKSAKEYLFSIEEESENVNLSEAKYLLSVAEEKLGEYDECFTHAKEAFALNNANKNACLAVASASIQQNDMDFALKVLNEFTGTDEAFLWEIGFKRAEIYFHFRNFPLFKKAIAPFLDKEFYSSYGMKRRIRQKQAADKETNAPEKDKNYDPNEESESEHELEIDEGEEDEDGDEGEEGPPLSSEKMLAITNDLALNEGDHILNFSTKINKREKRIKNELNTKKDAFLAVVFDKLLSFCFTLVVEKEYTRCSDLINSISILRKRQFTQQILRTLRFCYCCALLDLRLGNYHASLKHLGQVIFIGGEIENLWKLLSFILSTDILLGRRYVYISGLLANGQAILSKFVTLGHLQLARSFYKNALRSYGYVYRKQPNNPFPYLYSGIACIRYAVSKKSLNSHRLVLTGFTFLFKYEKLRSNKMEAKYNLGRAFHQLNILEHAIFYYNQVLVLPTPRRSRNYKPIAAFNLAAIYRKSGSTPLAKNIMMQFLTY